MTLIGIIVLLAVAFLIGYLIRFSGETTESPDIDPEQAMKAAVELHRIRRNLDVARTRNEQRRSGAALRREIKKTLEGDGE